MSMEHKANITCPQCRKSGEFTIWQSINTTLDPEMKSAVLNGSAFVFTCPECGAKTIVTYSCLYHDMGEKIMIQLATSEEEAQDAIKYFKSTPDNDLMKMAGEGYLRRVVRSVNELREKAMIFEVGLDDRIIELYKVFAEASMRVKDPSVEDVSFLYFRDGENDFIQLMAKGQPRGVAPVSKELYGDLVERCKTVGLPDIREDAPVIDKNRAAEIMRKLR